MKNRRLSRPRVSSSAGSRAFIEPERKPSRSRVTNLKPSALKMRVNSAAISGVERARQLFASNFDAHDVAVMADAKLAEAQRANGVFALFDHAQSASRVTGRPYSMRDDRQAEAGLSQMRRPAARAVRGCPVW